MKRFVVWFLEPDSEGDLIAVETSVITATDATHAIEPSRIRINELADEMFGDDVALAEERNKFIAKAQSNTRIVELDEWIQDRTNRWHEDYSVRDF
jgi:hypothetical protein